MKTIKSLVIIFLTTICGIAVAQDANPGAIDQEMLINFKNSYRNFDEYEGLKNAVANNNIQKLALNRDNLGTIDTYFSHRIETAGITDQKSSGRCWLFTGLNVLKPAVIKNLNVAEFEFSQTYSFFFDQLEKSNLFLEGIISTVDKDMNDRKVEWLFKHPVGDGGQWTGMVDLAGKYGLVPKSVMPESINSENTRWMSKLIRRKLRENGLRLREMHEQGKDIATLRETKTDMLSEIYRMLAFALGEPPTEFQWRYKDKDGNVSEMKTYTPVSFYEEVTDAALEDYVMFMNDPSRDYGELYEIELDRHMHEGRNWKYINLENEKIKEYAINSIKGGDAMYFSCDVGKQLNKDNGTLDVDNYDYGALFKVDFGMNKTERIKTFESGSSHGMALVAVDLNGNEEPVKWLLENSWGQSGFEGHLIMTDEWFDEYMFRVVIHKKYLPEDIIKLLEQEPVMLPPWDPMF